MARLWRTQTRPAEPESSGEGAGAWTSSPKPHRKQTKRKSKEQPRTVACALSVAAKAAQPPCCLCGAQWRSQQRSCTAPSGGRPPNDSQTPSNLKARSDAKDGFCFGSVFLCVRTGCVNLLELVAADCPSPTLRRGHFSESTSLHSNALIQCLTGQRHQTGVPDTLPEEGGLQPAEASSRKPEPSFFSLPRHIATLRSRAAAACSRGRQDIKANAQEL